MLNIRAKHLYSINILWNSIVKEGPKAIKQSIVNIYTWKYDKIPNILYFLSDFLLV